MDVAGIQDDRSVSHYVNLTGVEARNFIPKELCINSVYKLKPYRLEFSQLTLPKRTLFLYEKHKILKENFVSIKL